MKNLKKLLREVRSKKVSVNKASEELKYLPYEDIGFAKIDHHRNLRRGVPEVIFCQGKTSEQIAQLMQHISKVSDPVMATRATEEMFKYVRREIPDVKFYKNAGLLILKKSTRSRMKRGSRILVITAGTSDSRVAEEAAVTLEVLGCRVKRLYDVGVAGIHRLLLNRKAIAMAAVIIVVAGMDGALASVVGGLTDKPVIGVPTSVGYGASFGGVAPLLTMLNSCVPGVAVVNIDNGFGAAYFAYLISKR